MKLFSLRNVPLLAWAPILLPHPYFYPCEGGNCGENKTGVYSLNISNAPVKWHAEPECPKSDTKPAMRITGQRYVSNAIDDVSGLSFKGASFSGDPGSARNGFGVFFHENVCYHGGNEYGWIFKQSKSNGVFYLCSNCNLSNQHWCTWPDIGEGKCPATGDCSKLRTLLETGGVTRYWNVKIDREGAFLIEVVDPVSWKTLSCHINRPDWFGNLYKKRGYVTANSQKRVDTKTSDKASLRIDEVKVWKGT